MIFKSFPLGTPNLYYVIYGRPLTSLFFLKGLYSAIRCTLKAKNHFQNTEINILVSWMQIYVWSDSLTYIKMNNCITSQSHFGSRFEYNGGSGLHPPFPILRWASISRSYCPGSLVPRDGLMQKDCSTFGKCPNKGSHPWPKLHFCRTPAEGPT